MLNNQPIAVLKRVIKKIQLKEVPPLIEESQVSPQSYGAPNYHTGAVAGGSIHGGSVRHTTDLQRDTTVQQNLTCMRCNGMENLHDETSEIKSYHTKLNSYCRQISELRASEWRSKSELADAKHKLARLERKCARLEEQEDLLKYNFAYLLIRDKYLTPRVRDFAWRHGLYIGRHSGELMSSLQQLRDSLHSAPSYARPTPQDFRAHFDGMDEQEVLNLGNAVGGKIHARNHEVAHPGEHDVSYRLHVLSEINVPREAEDVIRQILLDAPPHHALSFHPLI